MTRLEIAARMLAAENPIEERDVAADGANHARMALAWADALLAAAEKPAACAGCNGRGEVGGPLRDGSTQTDACSFCAGTGRAEKPAEVERCPNHHKDGRCSLDDGHAGDHVAKWGDTGAEIARWPRRLSDLGRDAEKPAESPFPNPVAKRDAEWTRAFAEAVGLDSGLAAPIIPGGVKACIEQLRAEKPAEAALAPDPGAHLHNCPATAMRCRVCPSSGPQACEQVPAPVVTGDIQFDPEGHAISPTTGKPTHVDPDGWFGFANMERAGVYVEARGLESARRAVRAMRDAGIAAVRGVPAPAPVVVPLNPTDFATACLRNSGIDVKCGACMEVAFTGATAAPHTCAMPSSALAEINNIAAHALGIATIHNPSPGFATANVKRLAKEHRALQTAPVVPPALPWVVRQKSDKQVFAAFLWEGGADLYFSRIVTPDEFEIVEVAAAPTVAPVKFDADGEAAGTGWQAYEGGMTTTLTIDIQLRPGEDAGETVAKMLAACGRGP